jgi:hypothetical protein
MSRNSLGFQTDLGLKKTPQTRTAGPEVQSVADQLRPAGYSETELSSVAKSIAEADAGFYVSPEERQARRKMMAAQGRFISRAEYLALASPKPTKP